MKIKYIYYLIIGLLLTSCGGNKSNESEKSTNVSQVAEKPKEIDPMKNKGIGPIKNVTLASTVDQSMADNGKTIFEGKCSACHKTDKRYIGPALKGILDRRTPEWVMNMILNPTEMVQKDPIAKKLLREYNGTPMANQSLKEDETRALVEYFRTL